MSSSADESSSISSTSLLVSPSSSSQGSSDQQRRQRKPPPTYGWDQVQDILDSSSSSSSGNANSQDDNDIIIRNNNNAALDREIALAMVDLTDEERRKLSILMKDEYHRKDTDDYSDEGDDYQGLLGFATPSLIHTTASKSAASTPSSVKDHHSNNSSGYNNSDRKRRAAMPTQYNRTSPVPVNPMSSRLAVYKSPLQSPISRASPRSVRSRQSPMSHNRRVKTPSNRQQQQHHHQKQQQKSSSRSPSPGFTSPLFGTGGFGSTLKIEDLIGSQWGQESRREHMKLQTQTDESQAVTVQTQRKIKSRKKSKQKHPIGNNNNQQQTPPQTTPILSPPINTSIMSAFQSVQDTLDAELQAIDSTREQRLEEQGEMMTPEPDMGSFMSPQLLLRDSTTPLPSQDGKVVLESCEEYNMIDIEEVEEDVNLALALDFDLVAEEHEDDQNYVADTWDTGESHREDVVFVCKEDEYVAAQDPLLVPQSLSHNADNDRSVENVQIHPVRENPQFMDADQPKPNNLLPVPSSHPDYHIEEANSPIQHPSPVPLPLETSIETSKPTSPHPVHPTLVASHTSSFDNVTNNEEDFELKPNTSLPMPSPQPMRPGLSNRATALTIEIPRLPPQDRGMNDTPMEMEMHDRSKWASIGRQSKVHPAKSSVESIPTNDLKSVPIKPRDSLKSSLKAMFKRSNSYGEASSDKGDGIVKRSYSQDGESSKHQRSSDKKLLIPKPRGMRTRSSSDAGYSRLKSASSFDSFEAPRSTNSQRAKLHGQSLEAPSSFSASQRRKEYDAKLRADMATKFQKKQTSDDKTTELPRFSTPRSIEETKSRITSTDTDQKIAQTPIPSPAIGTSKESLDDVVELVTESLDVSHMIYDDNLEAIAAAEMDESAEFEATEKLCSEMQTIPVHLKPEPSCSDAQSVSVHSDEFFDTIAENADDILSLCVDGQLLAEDDQFYDITPVNRILYQDNYDEVAAFETQESQAFVEAELHCSDGSMFEDALENHMLSPIVQSNVKSSPIFTRESHEMISKHQHLSATLIQQSYRKHQMKLAHPSHLNLTECSDLLPTELYDCLQKMQEMLSLHSGEDRTDESRLSQNELQKQNYLEYYEHLMALFNSKIREMELNNMQSGASNASKIQHCIRSLYVQKDYQQLQRSLQVLQSCASEHQCNNTIVEEPSTPINISHEIEKYARSHMAMLSLQARFRGSRARLRFRRIIVCITALQAIFRGKSVRRSYFQARAIRFRLRRTRVVKMQAIVRGSLQRQSYQKIITGMTLLQARLRGAATRVHLLTMETKAVKLQAFARRKIAETRRHKADAAVVVLQRLARVQQLERRSQSMHKAAITIQRQCRASQQIHRYITARKSLVTLQRNVRGMLVRIYLSRCRSCATLIQS
eukprot:scaffold48652_cov66-Cyclotella_meneghiniana.AAC.1